MVVVFLVLSLVCTTEGANLLTNPGFEETGGWRCPSNKFNCTLTTDKFDGRYAWLISDRTKRSDAPSQAVTLEASTRYNVSAYIKLVNDTTNELFQDVRIQIKHTTDTIAVAVQPTVFENKWTYLYGDFITPSFDLESARLQFNGPNANVSFIVDKAALEKIPENTNWRADTDAVINRIRKQDMNFKVSTSRYMSAADVKIMINQTEHAFPFGAMVKAEELLNESLPEYRNYIYKHMFNWALLNSLKWKQTEPIQGQIDYDTQIAAVKELKKHGLKVRGHNIVWPGKTKNPDWVQNLTGQALKDAVSTRIQGVVGALKGMLDHWAVSNENVHVHFYQEQTNDFDYYLEIYRQVNKTDQDTKLYTNDYDVVNFGSYTQAYLEHVQALQKAKVRIDGIGAQSHFKVCPDPTLIKLRLDRLAKAKLPIFITEHNLKKVFTNATEKADCLEKSLRSFFGHPAVKGILLWGFWSGNTQAPQGALVDGPNFVQNEAGDRVWQLLEGEWRTYKNRTLSEGNEFKIRGFRGKYVVRVTYKGNVLVDKEIVLGGRPKTMSIQCTSRKCSLLR